jgi:hypothetical protein
MMRKFTAMVSAAALAATVLAPTAQAREWRGGGYGHYGHYGHYGRGNGAAIGAVGLIFGLALGAALSQPRTDRCYNDCDAYGAPAGPPPGYYARPPARADDDPGSAYEQDYGQAPPKSECSRPQRQWDRYANRYVTVDVPC